MKAFSFAFATLLLACGLHAAAPADSASASGDIKALPVLHVGVVRITDAVQAFYKTQAAVTASNARMTEKEKQMAPKLEAQQKTADQLKDLSLKFQGAMPSDKGFIEDDFKKQQSKLRELSQQIGTEQSKFKSQMLHDAAELTKGLLQEVNDVAVRVARQAGCNLVFDKANLTASLQFPAVILADPSIATDLTDAVIAELNNDKAREVTASPAKPAKGFPSQSH